MENCIICHKEADATGSHLVPASLIKNCVGKHYVEESYEIDAKKVSSDIYFGRDNLKNKSTEIKENHYKKDNILCQECENRLGHLEGSIYTQLLQKCIDPKFDNQF